MVQSGKTPMIRAVMTGKRKGAGVSSVPGARACVRTLITDGVFASERAETHERD